jgi:hypothetical protein
MITERGFLGGLHLLLPLTGARKDWSQSSRLRLPPSCLATTLTITTQHKGNVVRTSWEYEGRRVVAQRSVGPMVPD